MVDLSRRSFFRSMTAIAAGGLAGMDLTEALAQPIEKLGENAPRRMLGKTGWQTPAIGLGTIFRPPGPGKWMTGKEAEIFIGQILDAGINVIDTAEVYRDAEQWIGRVVPKIQRDKVFISTKSTQVTKDKMLRAIEKSLKLMKTDYLDCAMMHNYFTFMHYEIANGEDGALEGLKQAQKEGKARFIGMSSHSCQTAMNAMHAGDMDVFTLPRSPMGREFTRAMDLAAELNIGVLNMKPLSGGSILTYNKKNPLTTTETFTVQECLRYSMSHPGISCPIPNMVTLDHLKENLAVAATFKPMTEREQQQLLEKSIRISGGVCGACPKPCEDVCPYNVPISCMLSDSQAAQKSGWDNFRRGDNYQTFEHDFNDCMRCGKCEEVCPNSFEIIKEMENYDKKMREYRGRTAISYGKTYRGEGGEKAGYEK